MKLKLADKLTLPEDAVTQTFGFIGRKGSGKSYGAGKLVELLVKAGNQVVVLDPVGNWHGLRVSADGRGPGLAIPIFGGLRGDVPLVPTGGAVLATMIVQQGLSALVDVAPFRFKQRKEFVAAFTEELFHRKKSNHAPMHIVVDEAQVFVPEGGRDEGGAFEEIVRIGRNYGIGVSLITQRPQSVSKEVLNQVEALLVFQLNGALERDAIKRWIAYKGIDVHEMMSDLPALPFGDCFVWSPAWLRVLERVRILPKETFDSTATPTVGKWKPNQARVLAPVELSSIQEAMKATIEEAESQDPAKLRTKVTLLQAQLQEVKDQLAAAQEAPAKVVTKVTKQADIDKAVKSIKRQLRGQVRVFVDTLPAMTAGLYKLKDVVERHLEVANSIDLDAKSLLTRLDAAVPTVEPEPAVTPADRFAGPNRRVFASMPAIPPVRPQPPSRAAEPNGDLTKPQQKILDAVAWWASLGVPKPDLRQIGFRAGYKAGGGGFKNYMSSLSTGGLIDRNDGTAWLTEKGRELANPPTTGTTLKQFHDGIRALLPMPQQSIFNVLVEASLEAGEAVMMSPESIGAACEPTPYAANGGGFKNYLSALSTAGIIERSKGLCSLASIMFPPGLT